MNYAARFGHTNTTYSPGLAYIVEKVSDAAKSYSRRITANGILVCDHEKIISSNAVFTLVADSGKVYTKFNISIFSL